jgi:hypothetical protein
MTEILIIPDEILTNKIYYIRGTKVMFDHDLATLYNVETKVLKQAVKRNIQRFPLDFMFEMTRKELVLLKSQGEASAEDGHGGLRYLPFCFTEAGIAMLSSVLKSERAIQVNIQIIRIFIKIRVLFADQTVLRLEIERIKNEMNKQGKNVDLIFHYFDELSKKVDKMEEQKQQQAPRKRIGFKSEDF